MMLNAVYMSMALLVVYFILKIFSLSLLRMVEYGFPLNFHLTNLHNIGLVKVIMLIFFHTNNIVMKSLIISFVFFTSVASLTSCKSVGYHMDGKSTILRYDTVHVYIQGDKPYTVESTVK